MVGMAADRLVLPDSSVPLPPRHALFEFEVLGPEHNESDLAAWSSSMAHIHASPGWRADGWPDRAYTLEENHADLEQHREHHDQRLDFAWTVLSPGTREVIGCVYLKPDPTGQAHAEARSWVRADHADLDRPLREHLAPWFLRAWPFPVRYAGAA
jgi:RimJ/RimL family protein N-acetyltransferase